MNERDAVLKTAHEALKQEFRRISHLLSPGKNNPLGIRHPYQQQVRQAEARVRRLLDEVGKAIDDGRLKDGGANWLP
jgi:hypothetical protein